MLRIQIDILRMIAEGEPLDKTAHHICTSLEAAFDGAACSIFTMDRAGLVHPLAAPRLPEHFGACLHGMTHRPDVATRETAAPVCAPEVIEDVTQDPRFAGIADVLGQLGLKTCWSFPISDSAGDPIGALIVYVREPRGPTASERALAETCADMCATALRRQERIADRERRASIDALTGLPNRSAFNAALATVRCDEPGSWALFAIDLDNLKIVNDTFGHLAGDALIRNAAGRIAHVMARDPTFRLGGDEFAVIVQVESVLADLDAAADRIFRELEMPAICEGHAVVPRATIGGAVVSPTEASANAVKEAADFALYHAKETGRGGFVRYWPGIGTRITHRRDAIRDVADALAGDRIETYYQPVVRLDTGEITGVEALCRMRTSDGEIVAAQAFEEAMTDAHVAARLTRHMLTTVANDMVYWRDQGIQVQHVGVNLSAADFYAGSLAGQLQDIFGRANVSLKHLLLEVREDICVDRRDGVVERQIAALRAAGIRIALDNFGTGCASLTHLMNVPVDIIKIDRSFVARLWPEDPSMVVVEGLIEIASRLGICVVAEGIETEVQASQLWSMGCKLGQGFAFARACDREATAALLRRHAVGTAGATPLYAGERAALSEIELAKPGRRWAVG